MAKLVFTPWKHHSQLLSVRGQFYPPPAYIGPDMRSRACATVSAWKLRGSLPHAVEATSLLTDAILHDDALKNSVFAIRATYAAAFCRFVTLLVDSKIHGQRKTMFQRAVDLGLPASFVELRHEATHRELPSLVVLRNAAQRSLEWLWDYYWAKIDPDIVPGFSAPIAANGADEGAIKDAVRGSLAQLTGDDEPPKKKRKARGFKLVASVADELESICRTSSMGRAVLAKVLIDERVLVPERELGTSLDNTFAKWERLLQLVIENHPPFLSALTEEMVNELAFTNISDSKNNPYCEGLYTWLDRILTSTQWEPRRQIFSFTYIIAVCDESPNHWTELLKERLRKLEVQPTNIPTIQSRNERHEGVSKPKDTATVMEDSDELKKYGWEFLEKWASRPLGVA
ncbi:Cell morphogenesis protein Las1 [Aspergillus sclerotialis]|uniref:Cell morphogenesis protein Las1 n=1 Tax=Aspergillus sclerotialis TaxID=2070753 RepID=A0A3A2ZPU4_9EURO|nr:Cell morphogenesis protein Las1 [Aspergillus sclerotialis]